MRPNTSVMVDVLAPISNPMYPPKSPTNVNTKLRYWDYNAASHLQWRKYYWQCQYDSSNNLLIYIHIYIYIYIYTYTFYNITYCTQSVGVEKVSNRSLIRCRPNDLMECCWHISFSPEVILWKKIQQRWMWIELTILQSNLLFFH